LQKIVIMAATVVESSSSGGEVNVMVSMEDAYPEFYNRVRFDRETRKASVLDVIGVMTSQNHRACNVTFLRLGTSHPELHARFEKIQINGKVSLSIPANQRSTRVYHW
jgi:Ni,Fe-hydrogenase III small subunit